MIVVVTKQFEKDVQKELDRLNPTNVETVTNIDNGDDIITGE